MKYIVNYEQTYGLQIEVEAKDKEEARDKADEIIASKPGNKLRDMSQQGYWEFTYTDEDK